VKVRHAAAAAAAAQTPAQLDREIVLAELGNVVGGEEDTAMLAPSADCDQRHFRVHDLTER
jgi:hypothetical protein